MNFYSMISGLPKRQPAVDPRPTAIRKLEKLATLRDGWSGGCGQAIQQLVIECAKSLIYSARKYGFLESDVFPGLQGDIVLTIYSGPHCLEFTIRDQEGIDFIHEKNMVELYAEDNLSLEASISKIEELRKSLCASFDFSKQYILTGGNGDSEVSPSKHLEETVVYPSWMKIVSGHWEIQSANMSPSITPALRAV